VKWFARQTIYEERVITDSSAAFVSRDFTTLCRAPITRLDGKNVLTDNS
jgi:hypothetical protein